MPIDAGTLVTSYKADTRDLERGAERAERRVSESARRMDASFSGANRSAGGFLSTLSNISNVISALPAVGQLAGAIVTPLTDAAKAGIMFNATLESARVGFTGITKDAAKTEEHLKSLERFSNATPFEFTGLLAASRYMNVFGIQLDEQIPKLRAWGDVIAASGDFSEDKVMGVVRAFGQMTAKGRVSAEEMEQLAERNFPAWELLARAIGKTVGETRKLAELGRLKGGPAMEAITAMAAEDPRFKGQMEAQSQTFLGRVSNYQDLYARASGMATQGLFDEINRTMEAGLKQSGMAETMAQSINTAITPVAGMIRVAAVGLLGGGITEGLSEGIKAGQAIVAQAVSQLGLGAISTFKNVLGIESPSKVFYEFGLLAAEGFELGLQDGTKIKSRQGDTLRKIAERHGIDPDELARINQLPVDAQLGVGSDIKFPGRKSRRAGVGVLGAEIDAIIKEAANQYGIDPDLIRAMIHTESRGQGNATSPKGARGLMQLMPDTARAMGVTNITDPRQNIFGGVKYMRQLLDQFGGDTEFALAGYNAGPGRVRQFGGVPPPSFARGETFNYVREIMANYDAMKNKAGGGLLGAWTKDNPLPVAVSDVFGGASVLGGQIPTPGDLDKAGGWGDGEGYGPALPGLSGLSGGSSNPFGASNLNKMFFQGSLDLFSIADKLGPIPKLVGDVDAAFQKAKLGAGEWFDVVAGGSKSLAEQLKEVENSIPAVSDQFKGLTASIPEEMGLAFASGIRTWDGQFSTLWESVWLGFSDMLRNMGAQLIQSQVTKLLTSLIGSIAGAFGGGGGGFNGPSLTNSFIFGGSRAGGGPALAGKIYETHGLASGKEVFVPKVDGMILNQGQMRGGGNTYVTINVPIARSSGYTQPKNRRQLADDIWRRYR